MGRSGIQQVITKRDGRVVIFRPQTHVGHEGIQSPTGGPAFGFPGGFVVFLGSSGSQGGSDVGLYLGDDGIFGCLGYVVGIGVVLEGHGNQGYITPVSYEVEITKCSQEVRFTEMSVHFLHFVGSVVGSGFMGIVQDCICHIDDLVERPPIAKVFIGGFHLKILQFVGFNAEHLTATQFSVGDQVIHHHLTQVQVTRRNHGVHFLLVLPIGVACLVVLGHHLKPVVAACDKQQGQHGEDTMDDFLLHGSHT